MAAGLRRKIIDQESAPAFSFPDQMVALRPRVLDLFQQIFDQGHDMIDLCGVYFCSATRAGVPIDWFNRRPGQPQSSVDASRAFFIAGLFQDILRWDNVLMPRPAEARHNMRRK
jgi:type VI protein secretion system component VasK